MEIVKRRAGTGANTAHAAGTAVGKLCKRVLQKMSKGRAHLIRDERNIRGDAKELFIEHNRGKVKKTIKW